MRDELHEQDRREVLHRVLGDPLVVAIDELRRHELTSADRRRKLWEHIFEAMLDRVQSTSGTAMLAPYEDLKQRISNLEQYLNDDG